MIDIKFNNITYSINDSVLSDAKSTLIRHLSTAVDGVGATIVVDGVVYNIDAGKLSAAANKLMAHLETVQGNGIKVSINGVEHELDSTRLIDAFTSLHTAFDTLANGGETPEPETGNYLIFSSPNGFTLNTYDNLRHWDGILEYSTDNSTWNKWDGTTLSANDGKLYMRGTGNTYITGSIAWVLTGNEISCIGNIENLLDYTTVANGKHPIMADYCYNHMFSGCTSLTTAPKLPATTLTSFCYGNMFYRCTSLIAAPELPATTLADNCYRSMFYRCTSLTTVPKLPATTLADYCYNSMFYRCTSLITVPELPATTLTDYCYRGMFNRCTNLKLSTEQTDEYTIAYRIPTSRDGTTADDALINMFALTGGTFTDTPEINTTYYLHSSNSVVPSEA